MIEQMQRWQGPHIHAPDHHHSAPQLQKNTLYIFTLTAHIFHGLIAAVRSAVVNVCGDRADAALALPHLHAADHHHSALFLHRGRAGAAGVREAHAALLQVASFFVSSFANARTKIQS